MGQERGVTQRGGLEAGVGKALDAHMRRNDHGPGRFGLAFAERGELAPEVGVGRRQARHHVQRRVGGARVADGERRHGHALWHLHDGQQRILPLHERIGAPDHRVAASTFFLGFAARLWSIGLGGLAEHGMLIDLDPDELWYAETGGTVRLHLPNPVAWQGPGLDTLLADMVLSRHLTPLADAVRQIGPISAKLLRGNAASAVLGAARALHRHRGAQLATEPCWELAQTVCADERLSDTICFNEIGTDYRRTTCCLFYRTPTSGLCVDCALTHKPQVRSARRGKGST